MSPFPLGIVAGASFTTESGTTITFMGEKTNGATLTPPAPDGTFVVCFVRGASLQGGLGPVTLNGVDMKLASGVLLPGAPRAGANIYSALAVAGVLAWTGGYQAFVYFVDIPLMRVGLVTATPVAADGTWSYPLMGTGPGNLVFAAVGVTTLGLSSYVNSPLVTHASGPTTPASGGIMVGAGKANTFPFTVSGVINAPQTNPAYTRVSVASFVPLEPGLLFYDNFKCSVTHAASAHNTAAHAHIGSYLATTDQHSTSTVHGLLCNPNNSYNCREVIANVHDMKIVTRLIGIPLIAAGSNREKGFILRHSDVGDFPGTAGGIEIVFGPAQVNVRDCLTSLNLAVVAISPVNPSDFLIEILFVGNDLTIKVDGSTVVSQAMPTAPQLGNFISVWTRRGSWTTTGYDFIKVFTPDGLDHPLLLPGWATWLDGSTLPASGVATSWPSLAPGGADAVATDGVGSGTVTTGATSTGSKALAFDAVSGGSGAAGYALPALLDPTEDGEVWIVVKSRGDGWGSWKFGVNDQRNHFPFSGTIYDDTGSAARASFSPTMSISSTARVYRIASTSTGREIWLDGILQSSAGGTPQWTQFPILGRSSPYATSAAHVAVTDYGLKGDIAFCAVRDRKTTGDELTAMYAYLKRTTGAGP